MKKLVLIATAAVFALGIGFAVVAADAPTGPIKVTNFGKKKVVTYDHSKAEHAAVECVKCHHNEADGNYTCGAAECHQLKAGDAPKIKDAMHKKEVGPCWECHLKKGTEKKMKCADCHKD